MYESKLGKTMALGVDFWNDSCDLQELSEAVAAGAVGATSNPVIVASVVERRPELWLPVLDGLLAAHTCLTEDDVAWLLVEEGGRRAAEILLPVYERTRGRKGRLSLQVNPKLFPDAQAMLAHALELRDLAPNLAIKVPAVPAGLRALEELTARGVSVNATVSFTLAQTIACAEAIEAGLRRAEDHGLDPSTIAPHVTLMVGRIDDHLRRVTAAQGVLLDPGVLDWAGVAIFKRAYTLFRERGYRATLLAAAYRCHLHWSQLIGEGLVLSIPYDWWQRFDHSTFELRRSIEEPVPAKILVQLQRELPDFIRAYEPEGLAPADFLGFGPSRHTLLQFLEGYQNLVGLVRRRMLR
ncbi:MAG: transaldolase [Deltaproteobacteria bacterium RIFOXYA12_FULL_61_11]|nr:MAG: transaldolase [Deltaproteobacteria bacterium RIFOXYA12_FULL_61_11]